MLKPFWNYYGAKWRTAPKYPAPDHPHIVEPFAGSAGYSLRHPDRAVTLVEKHPTVADLWRYLIGVGPAEILRIPLVDSVADLPAWVPSGGRALVGFNLNSATTTPRVSLSAGLARARSSGRRLAGWSSEKRDRVAAQVGQIKHWRIIEGDYTQAPDIDSTWFVDPPYNNAAGRCYPQHRLDYSALGLWCRGLPGQVIVCENEGADWLPFRPFGVFQQTINGKGSREVIWP